MNKIPYSDLPPGTLPQDIDGAVVRCEICGRILVHETDSELCPYCERKEESLEESSSD